MIYNLLRPLLFRLDAERTHYAALSALKLLQTAGLSGIFASALASSPRQVMGLQFPNPVGLAAGLDKNGAYIDELAALGFGFIEVGTVTPRPQPGNPKPRLYRLPQAQAIINRLGFNNDGVEHLIQNLQKTEYTGILGINIGKNFDTPIENAVDDYLYCMRKVYIHASYITVNISSPNTKHLRQLQDKPALERLLACLKAEQKKLAEVHGKYTPMVLKISPDLEIEQIAEIAELLLKHQVEGVIATNTTLSRAEVEGLPDAEQEGGLSGAPVREKSNFVVRQLSKCLGNAIPIIGVGGILSGQDAQEKINAGACLIQLYSGLIYRGPGLVKEVVLALEKNDLGCASV